MYDINWTSVSLNRPFLTIDRALEVKLSDCEFDQAPLDDFVALLYVSGSVDTLSILNTVITEVGSHTDRDDG